jgi:uncharacterized membrane protein
MNGKKADNSERVKGVLLFAVGGAIFSFLLAQILYSTRPYSSVSWEIFSVVVLGLGFLSFLLLGWGLSMIIKQME